MKPSKKSQERRRAWLQRKAAHLATSPDCAAVGLPGGHWGPIDVHHIQPRGMGGTKADDSPLLTLCRYHHEWVESHREEARELGFLQSTIKNQENHGVRETS